MRHIWKHYSLSIVLCAMFLAAFAAQTWTGWKEFAAEEAVHGQAAQWFGDSGYIWVLGRATMENWQSEFLQLFVFVVLTSFLSHTGSPESRDSEEKTEHALARIERSLKRLEQAEHREPAEAGSRRG